MKMESVASLLGGRVVGDGEVEIAGVRDLAGAGPTDLSFVQSEKHLSTARASRAAAFLVPAGMRIGDRPCVEVVNPKASFIRLLASFLPAPPAPAGVHARALVEAGAEVDPTAWVGPMAVVGAGAAVGAGARIEAGAVVGEGCRIGPGAVVHANATLYPRTVLGARSVVHGGATIGADGFGYVQEGKRVESEEQGAIDRYLQVEGPHVKVPQLGDVVIGEDVEIGACSTIDRGAMGSTVVGEGTKIDNQVQIAHNCRIGKHVIIVAEVGIGGSVGVGDHVTIGGNCGISEGCEIGAYCIVGAHTLMYPGKRFPARTVIFGNPAREAGKTREVQKTLASLPRLARKLQGLERRLQALERL